MINLRLTPYALRLKRHDWRLAVIIALYLAVAIPHSLIAPLTVGNDEWAHFLYTRFIAEHGRLPTSLAERENVEEAGTKADDPPLYHLLVAGLGAEIEPVRLLRPVDGDPFRQLADNMVVSYAFIVHTAYEQFPFAGEVLLWYLGRAVSIACGGVLIALTYWTSLRLFPKKYGRALLSAALLAFIPAFIFHTSVMTYDGLGAVLTGLFLLTAIQAIERPRQGRWWILLGGLAGLAITTKYTSVLLPLEVVFVAWLVRRVQGARSRGAGEQGSRGQGARVSQSTIRNPQSTIRNSQFAIRNSKLKTQNSKLKTLRLLLAGVALVLTTSWWFGFVVWHFNTVEHNGWLVGVLEPLLVRGGNDSTAINVTAFLFGDRGVSVDLPAPARERNYPELALTMLDSFWAARINEKYLLSPWLALVFGGLILVSAGGLVRVWRRVDYRRRTWLLLLSFHTLLITPLIVLRLFLSFDPIEAVQGRHLLFPAATAIPILLVWGWQQWHRRLSQIVVASLLLWSVGGQLGWAALVYPGPMPVWSQAQPPADAAPDTPADWTPLQGLRLTGLDWQPSPVTPALEVTLWWRLAAPLAEDYLVELALFDQRDQLVSYALGHPVRGRYPTRAWEAGDIVKDIHWLPLVGDVGGEYRLRIRLLDRQAQAVSDDDTFWTESVSLSQPGADSPPCTAWIAGTPRSGDPLLQPLRLRQSFTVISRDMPRLVPPENGPSPRLPDVSREEFHVFIVGPDWAEAYRLHVGDRSCHQLQFELPPRDFTVPALENPLLANFNDQILLLGYDLPTRRINPGERLPLVLYWQALDYTSEDYRMFDNLLDAEQQRWGGYDRRAKDGYSTILWAPGEVITDAFGVPVDPAAPDGIYTIDLGWYRETTDGGAESLPMYANGQPLEQTSVRLGPVKVGGPSAGVVVDKPTPQAPVKTTLGGQITLLGYDRVQGSEFRVQSSESRTPDPETQNSNLSAKPPRGKPQNLKLTLYWQADKIPAADYTRFFHLRDAAGQNVRQQDSPPANGRYPTGLWEPDEVIVDVVEVSLADLPPGEYVPVVGLYNAATGDRLPTPDNPANEIFLTPLQVDGTISMANDQ